ncbi:hypothetical protein [uncultured Bacteroides sp.]|uniref:hypothetical protein n=1 Tax=uncultured Bacteroides sp. TaxID=162156 RepID=UPI0023D5FD1C|nr:hypothetical protein [uncultured Bacteroides sp.]MDE5710285.1 hypothetical protein [Bacteroides sp.]MDE5761562.1 hypothetical protein [Bacteroides sp.]
MELPKSQKKIARLLINEGLQRECRLHLQKVESLLQNAKDKNELPHDTYLKLYEEIYNFKRHITFRYYDISGSRYFMTITNLFCNGILTQKDINLFSEEIQQAILRIKQNFEE